VLNELQHLAIIMDGNGRWAKKQNKKRSFGHEFGAKKVRQITEHCSKLGIKYLTLYAFSTENWKRPKSEVTFLMKLLSKFLKQEEENLLQNNIRFTTIGDISKFSPTLQETINHLKQSTKECTSMTQILAINYGSKDEIIRAFNKAIQKQEEVTEENFHTFLDTSSIPPVDALIRTGGEQRLSNFLLLQAAYAELFFSPTLWPDFSIQELEEIITKFSTTSRRFGGI
jgi:undecaprenyl diphosphate synthase